MSLIAGVDEAGRGPLAGPVVAAAVVLRPEQSIAGVRDSKKLSPERRAELVDIIHAEAQAWAVGLASVAEIDELNILGATMLAMQRALAALGIRPSRIRIDGNRIPELPAAEAAVAEALVGGDDICPAIGAASIIAKVRRDEIMCELDAQYPGYGFAGHKGYPTRAHKEALVDLGPTPVHRMSFRPVREATRNYNLVQARGT